MKYPIYIMICLASLFTGTAAAAEELYPVVTYTCNTQEGMLKIKSEVKWDEEGRNFKYDPANGIYNPWTWVDIVKVAEGGKLITPKPPLKLTCAVGKYTYTIELEPKIFNRNPDGQCGNRISIIATIWRGGNMLLDHKEFESFCHGNSPVVRGVRITGSTGEMEIVTVPKYQFY
jgi:hypothetical protein